MVPAGEIYLALVNGTIMGQTFEDPVLLMPMTDLYIPGINLTIAEFHPLRFACLICSTATEVQHVWSAYVRHGVEIPLGLCLQAIQESFMVVDQKQLVHRWIYHCTGTPEDWPSCDLYLSIRKGCPSIVEDLRGLMRGSRLRPQLLKVPYYDWVQFDPTPNAFMHCPDARIIKHVWKACVCQGMAPSAEECLVALAQSPLPPAGVVELLKWMSFRMDLPTTLLGDAPFTSKFPHEVLLRKVLAELPAIRTKPFLHSVVPEGGCVDHILSFLLSNARVGQALQIRPLHGSLAFAMRWDPALHEVPFLQLPPPWMPNTTMEGV